MEFRLFCLDCGEQYDGFGYRLVCDACQGLLEVEYAKEFSFNQPSSNSASRLARFSYRLPIRSSGNLITLGEGGTPLIPLRRLGDRLDIELFAKLEYLNPTGSFKDRGNAVQVSVLLENGVEAIVDSAVGNAGHSTAAYCAKAGIRYIGFAEHDLNDIKMRAIAYHGTELHWVEGDRTARREAARKYAKVNNVLFFDYGKNVYFVEGQKTVAYEIAEDMIDMPDHVILPSGNGSLLLALWRGFNEMLAAGCISRLPRMHPVQSTAFQAIESAYNGDSWIPGPDAKTMAIGVSIASPPRLARLVEICREAEGVPVSVPDASTLVWQHEIALREGILIEPTSALVLAGLEELLRRGVVSKGDRVLLPLTGFGVKEPIMLTNHE